jgi:hypothetical protein
VANGTAKLTVILAVPFALTWLFYAQFMMHGEPNTKFSIACAVPFQTAPVCMQAVLFFLKKCLGVLSV